MVDNRGGPMMIATRAPAGLRFRVRAPIGGENAGPRRDGNAHSQDHSPDLAGCGRAVALCLARRQLEAASSRLGILPVERYACPRSGRRALSEFPADL